MDSKNNIYFNPNIHLEEQKKSKEQSMRDTVGSGLQTNNGQSTMFSKNYNPEMEA